MEEPAQNYFFRLYAGYTQARGKYTVGGANERGKMDGRALTVREGPTEDTWAKHLAGTEGLGVVPLRDDNTCSFGVIDIDVYNLDLAALCEQVAGLPVTVVRSKSGGAHVTLFLKEPAPATLVVDKLTEWAAAMGYGGCEIFPKQTMRSSDADIGNWINMPYFGGDSSTRYAMDTAGKALSMEEFLKHAGKRRITEETLEQITLQEDPAGDLFADGPPCLQTLSVKGFPDGTRNMGLFNVGVYMRQAHADDWQEKLMEYNAKHMHPQMKITEVQTVIKSLEKKSYSYRCKEQPICGFCNKRQCLKRKYGVGNGGAADDLKVMLGGLTKIDSEPPIWIVDLEGLRVEVDTETLASQRKFQLLCMERIHKCPPPVNANRWSRTLQEMLLKVEVIPAPADASVEGQFVALVEEYCSGSQLTKDKDSLAVGKVFYDTEQKKMYFRSKDLLRYLEQRRFRHDGAHWIWSMLRRVGADTKMFNIKGKCITTWCMPAPEQLDDSTPLAVPPIPKMEQDDDRV